MKETFTGRIRKAARALTLTNSTFTVQDLSIATNIKTRDEDRKIGSVIRELRKTGEIVRMGRGVYTYMGKTKKKKQIREIMWRALRAMRNVTVDDLREISGASEQYTKEWLRTLKRQDVVAERNGRYRLIKDTGPNGMPENEAKNEALRLLRQRKKEEALKALDRAEAAINEARKAMGG